MALGKASFAPVPGTHPWLADAPALGKQICDRLSEAGGRHFRQLSFSNLAVIGKPGATELPITKDRL